MQYLQRVYDLAEGRGYFRFPEVRRPASILGVRRRFGTVRRRPPARLILRVGA